MEINKNPADGLSKELFLFVTTVTPMINVDLLIKNERDHTLLTWRDDGHYPPGWHIPGGIIRYKETIADRINAVALSELKATVNFKKDPVAMNEAIDQLRSVRGHFISLLYKCTLVSFLDDNLRYKEKGVPQAGEWMWHGECPDNILSVHEMYRKFM